MKPIRLIAAGMVFALSLGGATSPARGAPAVKSSTSTTDLTEALKTMRPISVPLLEIDEVQTELKLSAEQKQTIADLAKAARDEFQAALQQPMPIPPVGAAGGVMVRAFTSRTIKYDTEKMAAALKPDQLIRLRQLELHLKGPQAFADRRVARVLNLTAEQDLKIEEIIMRFEPANAETTINARLNNLDGKPIAELGDKFVGECLKQLTKEQKASWDWLVSKRPEGSGWAKAMLPSPAGGFGGFAPAIGIQGGGVIRLAPLAPVAPPAVPAPPKKEDK